MEDRTCFSGVKNLHRWTFQHHSCTWPLCNQKTEMVPWQELLTGYMCAWENQEVSQIRRYHKTAARLCSVGLLGKTVETLISILAIDIVLCTLRPSNTLPFVGRSYARVKLFTCWRLWEMMSKRKMLSNSILNICFCLRAFLATNEEKNLYVKVLLHCRNMVPCETDCITSEDGIVLDSKFSLASIGM